MLHLATRLTEVVMLLSRKTGHQLPGEDLTSRCQLVASILASRDPRVLLIRVSSIFLLSHSLTQAERGIDRMLHLVLISFNNGFSTGSALLRCGIVDD